MWKWLNKGISTPIAVAIVLILVIIVGSFAWWQYGEIRKEKDEFSCRDDNDCIYGWRDKCIMKCVNRNTPKMVPCPLIKPAVWSSYIWDNISCECVNNKCVEDKEAFCQKACEDFRNDRDEIAKSAFLAERCGDILECEGLEKTDIWTTIWKEFLLSSQNISEDYFNSHISVESFDLSDWKQGTSFRMNYDINIDWATIRSCDHFLIKRKGETDYLTKDEIYSIPTHEGGLKDRVLLSNACGNSKKLKEFDKIISQSEVAPKLKQCHSSIEWSSEKAVILTNEGKLVVNAYGTIDHDQNKCKFASLDLEAGELIECRDTTCWVD